MYCGFCASLKSYQRCKLNSPVQRSLLVKINKRLRRIFIVIVRGGETFQLDPRKRREFLGTEGGAQSEKDKSGQGKYVFFMVHSSWSLAQSSSHSSLLIDMLSGTEKENRGKYFNSMKTFSNLSIFYILFQVIVTNCCLGTNFISLQLWFNLMVSAINWHKQI